MRNIWRLFCSDIRHLFANVTCVIIVIGLVVLPSMFTWYNVIACWDVFDNTDRLTVAVANDDDGYESELMPLRVNIGEQVLSALRANDDINWKVTNSEDAVDGASSGRYYAAIVIPDSFSQDMLTFYEDGGEHAKIKYYSNQKKSAIAPKVTDQGADSVSYQINAVFAKTLAEISVSTAQALSRYADQADAQSQIAALSKDIRHAATRVDQSASVLSLYAQLAGTSRDVLDSSTNLLDQMQDSADALSATAQDQIKASLEKVKSVIASLEESIEDADAAGGALDNAGITQDDIDALEKEANVVAAYVETMSSIDEAGEKLEDSIDQNAVAKEQLQNLKEHLEALSGRVQRLADRLASANAQLSSAVWSVNQDLGSAICTLDDTASSLSKMAKELIGVADKIDAALASEDVEQIRDVLSADASVLSNALSSPVSMERNAVFAVENFGSAMTPLYATLALFIGVLLIMVTVKPTVSKRAIHDLRSPKRIPAYQLFLGRYGVVAVLAFLQSTVLGLGNMWFLCVQVTHPLLFMVCYWVTGQVFAFIAYTLVSSFANLGKGILVLLLIASVTGCNGSFPLPLFPEFIQAISPWLPATHVVGAMRAAMMGVYGSDFWIEIGRLCLFVVPFIILGCVFQPFLQKFMTWYIKRVEASELMA